MTFDIVSVFQVFLNIEAETENGSFKIFEDGNVQCIDLINYSGRLEMNFMVRIGDQLLPVTCTPTARPDVIDLVTPTRVGFAGLNLESSSKGGSYKDEFDDDNDEVDGVGKANVDNGKGDEGDDDKDVVDENEDELADNKDEVLDDDEDELDDDKKDKVDDGKDKGKDKGEDEGEQDDEGSEDESSDEGIAVIGSASKEENAYGLRRSTRICRPH
jgi:hypothetical protein